VLWWWGMPSLVISMMRVPVCNKDVRPIHALYMPTLCYAFER
jgi:hypothetical protein